MSEEGIKLNTAYFQKNCRIAQLEEGPFKPLADELQSEEAVNSLLIAGFTVPIAASLLQTGLAYLYFRFGHAWSRVLNRGPIQLGKNHQDNPHESPI